MKKKRPKKKVLKEKDVDKVFSLYIRERDNWACQIKLPPTTNSVCNSKNIQNSHFHSRIKRSVRFDEENCDAFCSRCHMIVEEDKGGEYYRFKENQLGREKLDLLFKRSQEFKKFSQSDYKEMIDKFNKKIKELKDDKDSEVFGKH